MESLSRSLAAADFGRRGRGLDRDEVTAFLTRASEDAAALERRCRELAERADRAEARLAEAGDPATLQRTLMLAQRTADAAVNEAGAEAERIRRAALAEAERIRAAARNDADAVMAEGRARAEQLVSDTEQAALAAAEEQRGALREEVLTLQALRDRLHAEAARVEGHLAIQRERIRVVAASLESLLTDPEAMRSVPVPDLAPVEVPTGAPTLRIEVPAVADVPLAGVGAGSAHQADLRAAETPPELDLSDELGSAEIGPADLADAEVDVTDEPDVPIIDLAEPVWDPTPALGIERPSSSAHSAAQSAAETAAPAPDASRGAIGDPTLDDDLVRSFFEQEGFVDDRWKPRRDRGR